MPRPRRLAFCTVPHTGGIHSVYRNLREHLTPLGWEVFAVEVGDERRRWVFEPDAVDAGHRVVAPGEADPRVAAEALCDWLADERVDVLMPLVCPAAAAALPHLPASVRAVGRCVSISPQAYRFAVTHLDRLDALVVMSERQRRDLARVVPADTLRQIPNAVDARRFDLPREPPGGALRLAFLGRFLDREKGVLTLPPAFRELRRRNVPFVCEIAGEGSEGDVLRESLAAEVADGSVRMRGPLTRDAVPGFLAAADVLLMPSRHEGFPNTLVEGMAAGCAPVVSRLSGVTDWILTDGVDGLLCPVADPAAFAAAVERLHADRGLLASVAAAARRTAADRFDVRGMAAAYDALFREVLAGPPRPAPRPWSGFAPVETSGRPRLSWVPRRWKTAVRTRLERWRAAAP